MKYRIHFYQCAVYGINDETAITKREACRIASEFVDSFGRIPGHTRQGNVRTEGYTRIVDAMGATECMASIEPITVA